MGSPLRPPQIDAEREAHRIIDFIRSKYLHLNREIAIIGLSGGLDSSIVSTLAVKCLGPNKVNLYYLPERDSNPIHQKHAQNLADILGVSLNVISISPALRALKIYSLLPLRLFPGLKLKSRVVEYGKNRFLDESQEEFLQIRLNGTGNTWIRKANAYIGAKHRLRSVFLYREAERLNGMVIGSANRTEWMTGTFTHFGCDHNADIMPLLHLYRSQLEGLAAYLRLPSEILDKAADPDVLPGINDKGSLLGSFEIADTILWAIENKVPERDIISCFGLKEVANIKALIHKSAYYRDTPYSLL